MILIEVNKVAREQLPIGVLKQHLRLGSGFAEDSVQDDVLESYLRAALSSVEGRTGQAIFQRDFLWQVPQWDHREGQVFPLAPVWQVGQVVTISGDGARQDEDLSGYTLVEDPIAPKLAAVSGRLPEVKADDRVEVLFTAGSAIDWGEVPSDLAQATLLMAAHYYEYRTDVALGRGCTPFGVTALLERYRPMRIGMRARA